MLYWLKRNNIAFLPENVNGTALYPLYVFLFDNADSNEECQIQSNLDIRENYLGPSFLSQKPGYKRIFFLAQGNRFTSI
jgi:hypothetical protein